MSAEIVVSTLDHLALDPKRKLRAACNNCHQSKVRCTGGNPCARCADLQFSCEYSYSARIGKPKGSKSKRTLQRLQEQQRQKRQDQEQQQQDFQVDRPQPQHNNAPVPQETIRPINNEHPSPLFANPPSTTVEQSEPVSTLSPGHNIFGDMLNSILDRPMGNSDEQATLSPEPRHGNSNSLASFDEPETPDNNSVDFWVPEGFDDAELDSVMDDSFSFMGEPFGPAASNETDVLLPNQVSDLEERGINSLGTAEMVFSRPTPTTKSLSRALSVATTPAFGPQMPATLSSTPATCSCLQQLNTILVRLNQVERQHGAIQVDLLLISAMPSLSSCHTVLGCTLCLMDLRITNINILILRTLIQWLFSSFSRGELSAGGATGDGKNRTRVRLGRYDIAGEEAAYAQNFFLSRVVCRYRVVVKALQGRLERAAGRSASHDELAVLEERKMDLAYFNNVTHGLIRRLEQFIRLYRTTQASRRCSNDMCGDAISI